MAGETGWDRAARAGLGAGGNDGGQWVGRKGMSASADGRRSWLSRAAERSRSFFAVLYPCRFAILAVVVPGLALITVPQLQECIRALAERTQFPSLKYIQWTAVFAAALYWATSAWYWTRQLLSIRLPARVSVGEASPGARALLPRLIGAAALVLLAIAIWRAGRGYASIDGGEFVTLLKAMALLAGGLAAGFFLLVHFRRRLFHLQAIAIVARVRDLPRETLVVLVLTAAVTVGCFLAFWLAPLQVAPTVGVVAILLIAAAAWCTAGSAAVFVDGRYGVPVLPIAVIAVLLFSLWNDNHALRGTGTVAANRPTLANYTTDWLEARRDQITAPAPYPVLIVATAGGGIRAAYWTGSLLAALQDRYGAAFAEHTYAISGVSGGSLGAATFVTLLADRLDSHQNAQCAGDPSGSLQSCASAVLSQDFLAPVIGSMLFPDLVQRFLPFSIPAFDRARVIEGSWEHAWTEQGLPDSFSKPFYGLWSRPNVRLHAPLLFLNSTLVETGERVLASPVALPPALDFSTARDLNALTPADLPLSSAAHLSARFTYVSPAASVYNGANQLQAHLVDGGYFENTGADTAAALISAVNTAAKGPLSNIQIYVLLISNDPGALTAADSLPPPEVWLIEVRAPVAALLNARDARGREAAAVIGTLVGAGSHALPLGLDKSRVALPLGWTLSDVAQCEIDRQLAKALSTPVAGGPISTLDELFPVVLRQPRAMPGCA